MQRQDANRFSGPHARPENRYSGSRARWSQSTSLKRGVNEMHDADAPISNAPITPWFPAPALPAA